MLTHAPKGGTVPTTKPVARTTSSCRASRTLRRATCGQSSTVAHRRYSVVGADTHTRTSTSPTDHSPGSIGAFTCHVVHGTRGHGPLLVSRLWAAVPPCVPVLTTASPAALGAARPQVTSVVLSRTRGCLAFAVPARRAAGLVPPRCPPAPLISMCSRPPG